jgi:hypothetical protein
MTIKGSFDFTCVAKKSLNWDKNYWIAGIKQTSVIASGLLYPDNHKIQKIPVVTIL